jgi:dinuclear metal center YbgI/SA1388 family protein
MEAWAPPEIAWEGDNSGLQAGDPGMRIRGILVALDVTEGVVAEAVRRGANLIISHHPLLFRPLRSLTSSSARERCLETLLRKRIALYCAHTTLDFTRGGTSFALARMLGVDAEGFLRTPYRLHDKIVTFVPPPHADAVVAAMSEAGAGIIGRYENCSFRTGGQGTFQAGAGAHPKVGRTGRLEHVQEVRLEMVAPHRSLDGVIRALIRSHPYEEVAYDIYRLENTSRDHGMGVIGMLRRTVPLGAFLRTVRRSLNSPGLRWNGNPHSRVRRVALCGGSGSELLPDAVASGADVFVTADVRYHTYQEAEGRIALVDAGHFETEFPVVAAIVERVQTEAHRRGGRFPVRAASRSTNPVRWSL